MSSDLSAETSKSNESSQESQQTSGWKYKLYNDRSKVLKQFMKSEDPDREEKIHSKIIEIFEEDLKFSTSEEQNLVTVYDMFLLMLSNLPDKKKPGGKIMVQWFLNDFEKWEKENREKLKNQLTEETVSNATKYVVRDISLLKPFSTIFGFSEDLVLERRDEVIQEYFETRQFKEAADLIMRYDLVDKFSFEELVLPLILCDKCQVVDELLKLSPRFQKEYITFFDQLVGETDENVDAFFEPYKQQGLLTINTNRYHGKSLTTFIQKFFNGIAKRNNFDLEERRDAPKFEGYMKGKALKYFSKQRFELGAMSDEIYFEHAKNTLQNSSMDTVCYYFMLLWNTRIEERRIEVLFWIKYINIPVDYPGLPYGAQRFFKNPDPKLLAEVEKLIGLRTSQPEEEVTEQLFVFENEQKYPIKIVKTESELEDLCVEMDEVENGTFVGYDSEFRPGHLTDTNTIKVATIQLCFHDTTYLIDCVELENEKLPDKMWIRLYQSIFESKKLTVVGFDLKHDIEALFSIHPIRQQFKIEDIENFVCVRRFSEILMEIDINILNLSKSCRLVNLSEELLDITIDKSEQNGNWMSRPLRKSQIVYATMDSVVVLKVFEKVLELAQKYEQPLEIDKLMEESRVAAFMKKEKVKREGKCITAFPWEEVYQVIQDHRDPTKPLQKPFDLKLVIDTMLLGLGKNLRLLGVDVYIPIDSNGFTKYLREMRLSFPKNQRLIITVPSKSYETHKEENPNAHFFVLNNVYNTRNPLEHLGNFLNFFNLDIRKEDGFAKLES
ncbi:hypothetical protein L3Y34_001923 [Caenorhabditis briggsae]|uniref:3'-5' exonuclease domain-containing protein n=1 Tax=Caenorhabditis briggsae TaxID=6238 RepID=A0AAE9IRZ4_CAEBR|nr:hypothetical protein L3Y34_001923 [Caenorhabditis briggsae]